MKIKKKYIYSGMILIIFLIALVLYLKIPVEKEDKTEGKKNAVMAC